MCFHIDGSNHVTRMFYDSVVSGISPDGKPWTKDSVLALEHVLGKNDADTLANLFLFVHEPDAWRKTMIEEYGIDTAVTSTDVWMGNEMVGMINAKALAKVAEATDLIAQEIETLLLSEFDDVADPVVAGPEDEEEEGDDEILEDDDELLDDEDGEEETASLPTSLTDLLKVSANTNRILEAA